MTENSDYKKDWKVTIVFNDDEKKASCSCGNQWVPDSINDTNCNECVQGVKK